MTGFLIGLLVPALIAGAVIALLVRRGLQFRELCQHGIEATGQVVGKRSARGGSSVPRQRRLSYRYTDHAGASHLHASAVSWDVYERHDEGSPIAIVYSAKNPAVSAPKYLVDQARSALGK